MKLSPIIAELRRRCLAFEGRVYGAAEFADIEKATRLKMPCAFVVPLGDSGEDVRLDSEYRQSITQDFGVVLFVSSEPDKTGLIAFDRQEDIRAEVLRAIVGWCPTSDVDEVIYDGSAVLDSNRARLITQLEFHVTYDIVDTDTRHGVDLDELPDFTWLHTDVDLAKQDGCIDAAVDISLE